MKIKMMDANKKAKKIWLKGLGVLFTLACFMMPMQQALASGCPFSLVHCDPIDCQRAEDIIRDDHFPTAEENILDHIREEFHQHREWLVRDFFEEAVLPALMLMTEQMSAVGLYQMQIVGEIYDAKLHLESQRLFNELANEANRDYYPTESFCAFGTNVRSLAASDRISRFTQGVLEQRNFTRLMGTVGDNAAHLGIEKEGRWREFIAENCDPNDNNRQNAATGMVPACGTGSTEPARTNREIDYTRFIDQKSVLDIDFRNGDIGATDTDEEDIIQMSNYLYGHDVPRRDVNYLNRKSGQTLLMRLRAVQAKRSVAQNSFNAIVGMKAKGNDEAPTEFLRAILQDMGMSDDDIGEVLGQNASYYAQLEILAKKMLQNTDFIANLYDKPANIERKAAALSAIELMLDRAIYESELRHEMLYSVLLSSYLEEDMIEDYSRFNTAVKTIRR